MKKAISLILTVLFAFAVCAPSFAANETSDSTALTYSVAANYTITIPESTTITNGIGTGVVSVNAESLLIANEKITFTITDAVNYNEGFKLVNASKADVLLDYTIANGENPVVKDIAFLEADAVEAYAGKSVTLIYQTDTAVAAGAYSDTITITVDTVEVVVD